MSHCLSRILERRFNRVGRPHVAAVWDGDRIVRRGVAPTYVLPGHTSSSWAPHE